MKKKLSLKNIAIKSFVTEIDSKSIIGASGCCLHDSEPGGNCYTYGHESDCGSTGTDDEPTGMNTMMFCSNTQAVTTCLATQPNC